MFEFGRDLRRLFAQARESDDLGWLELVPVTLVESEARQQTLQAGRMACARPAEGWLRAAALWREHARRSGLRTSLERATRAGRHAALCASGPVAVRVRIDTARTSLLAFDLCGDPMRLERALSAIAHAPSPRQSDVQWAAQAVQARLMLRQARLGGAPKNERKALDFASCVLDAACTSENDLADELRLDRAIFALETGVIGRDPERLDRAGRDLRTLIDAMSPDSRPLSRARALALCGKGLSVLSALAQDRAAGLQGAALFQAAQDQFTPDHSPLDWAVLTVLKGDDAPLAAVVQAETLTQGGGLIIGAMAREQRIAREIAQALDTDDAKALDKIAHRLRQRMRQSQASEALRVSALDWAADQIGAARLALAKAQMHPDAPAPAHIGLMLIEAAQTAREQGACALADRAELTLKALLPAASDTPYRSFNWNAPR